MANIVLFQHISLDGFAADSNNGLDWISYDQELEQYAEGIVRSTGAVLYGRLTYELMESYWPTVPQNPKAKPQSLAHARWLDQVEKIVFSRTLKEPRWQNTTVIRAVLRDEIVKLKQRPGGDLVIFGSPGLGRSMMELNLIDEYRLTLNPVILGGGKRSFSDPAESRPLRVVASTQFASGVVALHYAAVRS